MYDFSTEISRGVDLLDDRVGVGWENRIDLKKLDLFKPSRCVLGQLYGLRTDFGTGYGTVTRLLGIRNDAEYGFNLGGLNSGFEWRALTRQWKKRIKNLRKDPGRREQPKKAKRLRREFELAGGAPQ